jgi:hypothetical protein
MKRNLISVPQQRSRSTFLKCRAPCAAARSLAAGAQSPPRGPPTAAAPALWGAAPQPSGLAQPHATPPSAATRNRAGQVPCHRSDRATARSDQIDRLALVVVCKRPALTYFHPTPPGSPSLLQVSINSEEVQPLTMSDHCQSGRPRPCTIENSISPCFNSAPKCRA